MAVQGRGGGTHSVSATTYSVIPSFFKDVFHFYVLCVVSNKLLIWKDVKQAIVAWFKVPPRKSPGEREHDEINLQNSPSPSPDLKMGPLANIKKGNHWTVALGLSLRQGNLKQRGIA